MTKITVVGSYVTDLTARTPHMPKPGETVLGSSFQMGPGGKGSNQAVAAARLGADVTMVTKVGRDMFAEKARENFQKEGIRTEFISESADTATGAALIAVDDKGENMIVVTLGACGELSEKDIVEAEKAVKQADIILMQLETSMEAVLTTLHLSVKYERKIILNPAPYREIPDDLLAMVDCITPNETEAEQLTGIEVNSRETAAEAAEILSRKGVDTVIITLGGDGCFVQEKESSYHVPAVPAEVYDTTGAGDAFNGALAHFLAAGKQVKEASRLANAAAAISVTRAGTAPSMAYQHELE